MNKLVYILTLGVAAVAITLTTTVGTETTAGFADGGQSTQNVAVDAQNVTAENTVVAGTQSEAQIQITDGSEVLGTITTDTTVNEESTVVDSANADVTGDITAQA